MARHGGARGPLRRLALRDAAAGLQRPAAGVALAAEAGHLLPGGVKSKGRLGAGNEQIIMLTGEPLVCCVASPGKCATSPAVQNISKGRLGCMTRPCDPSQQRVLGADPGNENRPVFIYRGVPHIHQPSLGIGEGHLPIQGLNDDLPLNPGTPPY